MKINTKLAQLKTTIQEIKKISENLDNENIYKSEIAKLNKEISRLEDGITNSINELEEILREEDA